MRTMIWGSALLVAAVLAGCGGAEGFVKRADSVTISGTVVQTAGLAVADVSINMRCANGTAGRTKTAADGSYSVSITGLVVPCVLVSGEFNNQGATVGVYRAIVGGSGGLGTFTANMSPLTELLVALATGTDPFTYYNTFNSDDAPSTAAIAQALDALRSLAAAANLYTAAAAQVDLSGINPLTDALVPISGSSEGSAHAQQIARFSTAMSRANMSLSALTAAIVANRTAPNAVETFMTPVAAECDWLHSGNYRMINPLETDPLRKVTTLEINTGAMTATDASGTAHGLTSDGLCQFSMARPGETNTLLVSPGGMLAIYTQSTTSGARSVALGLPDQVLPVSELAGTWNEARWGPNSGSPAPGRVSTAGEVVRDSDGVVTASSSCQGQAACTGDSGPLPRFTANAADGGFDMSASGSRLGSAFLFKNAAGKSTLVSVADAGQLIVAAPQQPVFLRLAFPTFSFREFDLNGDGSVSDLADTTVTVTVTDFAAKLESRRRASDSRVETLRYDAPRVGLRYRAANACTISDAPVSCPELVQLPLHSNGVTVSMSVGTDPGSSLFNIAISRPDF